MGNALEKLYADHGKMRLQLQFLDAEVTRRRKREVSDLELLRSTMNDTIMFQNLIHHPKEDLVYARLLQRDPASVDAILDVLTDHAQLAIASRRFTIALSDMATGVKLPRGRFDQLFSEFVTAVQVHMNREESEFFPRAADRLTDVDWCEIDATIERIKGREITAKV